MTIKDDGTPPWESSDEAEDNTTSRFTAETQKIAKKISPYRHYFVRAKDEVEKGMSGKSIYIPYGLSNLARNLEISQRSYTLVGGASGTGKTAFVHQMYILAPYIWYKKNRDFTDVKLKIILHNMERPMHIIITKWVSFYLYQKYGILADTKFILGKGQQKSRVSQELFEKICEGYDYFDEMTEIMVIRSKMENPTGIYKSLQKEAEKEGKIIKIDEFNSKYVPNDEGLITLVILDHIGRIQTERGYTQVENLKKMSEYLTLVRDLYGFSPVVISQFNRGIQDVSRRKSMELIPEEKDFKGSSNMYEDSDVAMGIFNPWKYKIESIMDYNVGSMRNAEGYNRFRTLHVLKNSQGVDDFDTALHFIGEIGKFTEMPSPSSMNQQLYYNLANLIK